MPDPMVDDGTGEPMTFVPDEFDEWVPADPWRRGRRGACGRRQPFDQVEEDKLFFNVGEWTGVFIFTLFALMDGLGFVFEPNNDEADYVQMKIHCFLN